MILVIQYTSKLNHNNARNVQNNYDAVKAKESNKVNHVTNGNIASDDNTIRIMQINTANSKFDSFKIRLLQIIKEESPKVVIISESNIDNDNSKFASRQALFPNYKFEDKFFENHDTARLTAMIRNDVISKRRKDKENYSNCTIVLEINKTKKEKLQVVANY